MKHLSSRKILPGSEERPNIDYPPICVEGIVREFFETFFNSNDRSLKARKVLRNSQNVRRIISKAIE